jgi:glucose dehydrogenase
MILVLPGALLAQGGKMAPGDWPMFNRDLAGTRFSPLAQVDINNVNKLQQAWSHRLQPSGFRFATASGMSELTPIVLNGVMYISAQTRIAAVNAETGDEVWRYEVPGGQASPRGVAYWPGDKQNPARIFFTAGRNLIALAAATGKIDSGFGNQGTVDLVVPYEGVPTIIKNVLAVGATTGEQETGPPGNTRAFDARTGKKLWEFPTVPHPGQPGSQTWFNDGWKGRSGVNAWGWYMTADESRGILYMTLGAPTPHYYGGDRPGENLFADSIVALDAATGKYKWHFQTVHHDLWNLDLPSAPALVEIMQNGRILPALVEGTKSGYLYILDRVSGKPVFQVIERAVPKGDVPGEWYSPTQPIPVKPLPLARVDMSRDDLVTGNETTPAHAKACEELWDRLSGFNNDGPFSPFLLRAKGAPLKYSIQFPGANGGVGWGGVAVDPKSGYVFLQTHDEPLTGWMEKREEGGRYESVKLPYDRPVPGSITGTSGFSAPIRDAGGKMVDVPCFKPPWSRILAVNALTGEVAWRTTLGLNLALPEGSRQNAGGAGSAGPIVTAGGLVFIGATYDARFRAFEITSGKELWAGRLERMGEAVPITYQGKNGKQYVAITASDTVVGFALPDEPTLLRGPVQSRK